MWTYVIFYKVKNILFWSYIVVLKDIYRITLLLKIYEIYF